LKLAADQDILPLTSSMMGMEAVSRQYASYVRYRRDAGKSLDDLNMALQCMTHCAPTMKEALDQLPYIRWQTRAQKALTEKKVIDGKTQGVPYEGEMTDELFLDRTYLGDPDYLIEKFKKANDAGITNISHWMMWGGIEHEKLMRSIKLMGEKVIPELRDLTPPESLIDNALRSDALEANSGSFTVTGEKLKDS
jgi:alkanesulfonate monooxygenase SsuD/methylene tetrahydromethanopterin reductase-like flavin-dependent oxidoreductase (luciferase family)